MIFHLQCLRCKKSYDLSEEAMNEIGYTKYSYCDDCLREGLKLLKWDDEKKAGDIPYYVIVAGLGKPQTYHGMVMAWKDRRMAQRQIEETEALMRQHGHGGLCGLMIVAEHTPNEHWREPGELYWMKGLMSEEKE